MKIKTIVAVAVALELLAMPVLAQGASDSSNNGHHYQGGPKTETVHNMKHPQFSGTGTVGVAQEQTTNAHHYNGGPKTETVHHMGPKP